MKFKRFAALALVFAMIICALPFSASAITYTSEDFRIEISSGYAIITEYTGNDTSVIIPESFMNYPVTKIDDEAFYDCSTLTSIKIPKTVTTIGNYVFQGCTALKSIVIPSSVTSMGKSAFYGCTSLSSVEFNAPLATIPNNTFYNCSALSSINIPPSVTAIGNSAFYGCSSLTTVPTGGILKFGQRSFYKSGITTLVVTQKALSLPYYSFGYCSDLEKVIIFGTDTVIDDTAFANSSLITFYCKPGSTAEAFANENFYTVESILYDLGDVNNDGDININDVTAIQKHKAKISVLDDSNLIFGDVNGDGNVSIKDATTIQMYVAMLIDSL